MHTYHTLQICGCPVPHATVDHCVVNAVDQPARQLRNKLIMSIAFCLHLPAGDVFRSVFSEMSPSC